MTRRLRRAGLAALLLAFVGGMPPVGAAPMTEEDVVRLFVGGASAEAIVREIRSRDPRFDLSEEMLDELSQAGLPAEVVQAMVERQAERTPSAADPVPERPPAPGLSVLLETVGGDGAPRRLRAAETADPGLVANLGIRSTPEPATVEDVALFLACRTSTHVPDHWRNVSPLGRDFVSMPRHRMLAFVSGAKRPADSGSGLLQLDLPERLEADIEIEIPDGHDLSIGIAVRIAGRYYRLADDRWDDLEIGAGGAVLHASTEDDRRGRLDTLAARFDKSDPPGGENEDEEPVKAGP